jgi:hypothetical protein
MAKGRKDIKIKVKLKETDRQIKRLILDAFRDAMHTAIKKAASKIKQRVRFLIQRKIRNQPEYRALIGGKLQAEFGLDNPKGIEDIITIWANSITVFILNTKSVNGVIKGGIEIRAIKSDYSDVLADAAAVQKTENNDSLNWLEWLLLEGDKKIIRRYDVQYDAKGRAGAVMVKSKKSWGVPPEYAGTAQNNWVIRAMDNVEDEISDIVKEEINNAV